MVNDVMFFLVVLTLVFVINYFWSVKKLNHHKKVDLIDYVCVRFKLDNRKIKARQMVLTVSLINAFIISFVTTFITMIDVSFIWQFMIGFVLIFGLIYSLYEIYGRFLVKRGYGKNL